MQLQQKLVIERDSKRWYIIIRPKVVGPFPGPGASGSYVHRAALFRSIALLTPLA
jgi:hypothetical protein